ncbi:MAG: NAD(P)H-dependent oxidoreductase [Deltaproteobacteria bacterium]|jgi:multimeric flavodoxin WrbA|nr:NAD(P)H-dependent oxidoreductase [Deltaproteobacteria bacterium]
MKVVALNGSPKNEASNTLRLTRAFLAGAGYSEAEIVNVYRLNVKPCRGCFTCWTKTPGKCVIADDMAPLLDKIIEAKTLLFSFPLYYFSIPGGLKNVIDRQLPLNLPYMVPKAPFGDHPSRYNFSQQKRVVISTCGFWTSQGNYAAVTAQFSRLYGPFGFTKIYCGQGELFRAPELRERLDQYLEIVQKAGAEFKKGDLTTETLNQTRIPIFSKEVFERLADASFSQDPLANPSNLKNFSPEKDDSFSFFQILAVLYQPDGQERVIEFVLTDLAKTYQIVADGKGAVAIRENLRPYTTRIETPYALWRAIAKGEVEGDLALFKKKFKVFGDFSLLNRWDETFSGASLKPDSLTKDQRSPKATALVLFFPWLVFWLASPLDPQILGFLGILTVAFFPLLWLMAKPTIYERVSLPLIAGLSLAVLKGALLGLVLPLSFGLFGLLWLSGLFSRIPLTALYSLNSYGGERALKNPLFIRVNRILTAVFGFYFLLAPLWTFKLVASPALTNFTGLINLAPLAILGGFAFWFQRWYPAKWARS